MHYVLRYKTVRLDIDTMYRKILAMHKLIQRLKGEPAAEADVGSEAGLSANHDHAVPRWVKVSALVVIGLVLMFVISELLGVKHGPGRHGAIGFVARG
jgi:hypothetical protein